jgi:hypothetical protein
MTTDTENCVAVLTRCGPYSRAQAAALVPTLAGEEVAALKELHGRLTALDAAAEDGPPGAETKPEPWKLQEELNDVGRKFRRLESVIADREAIKAKEQKVAKAAKPNGDSRKRAEAAAGQAQSDGRQPLP